METKFVIIIIVVLVMIGLFITIYFIGRRSAKNKIEQVKLPSDQPGGEKLTAEQAVQVRNISTALHDDMSGWNINIFSRNMVPYNQLMQASDTMFVAVYNDFNNLYSSENYGSLYKWISEEKSVSSDWRNTAYSILQRMERLNLR
ncbi:MAG: hypothetical protein PHX80_05480 [Candidatus Nanoarchaeia archaeon]|nr:hypothetical protein [Candidatus Nanoarchaeia archaeon]